MKNLSIAQKIYICIGIIFAGYVSTLFINSIEGKAVDAKLDTVASHVFPAAIKSEKAYNSFLESMKLYQDSAMMGEEELVSNGTSKLTKSITLLEEVSEHMEANETISSISKKTLSYLNDYRNEASPVYTAFAQGEMSSELSSKLQSLSADSESIIKNLNIIRVDVEETAKEQLQEISAQADHQRMMNLVIFGCCYFLQIQSQHSFPRCPLGVLK